MYMFANMFKCMHHPITIMFMINGSKYLTHSKHFSYFNDKFMNVFISIESVSKSSQMCFLFGLLPDCRLLP